MERAARGNQEAREHALCDLGRSKKPLNSLKGFEPLIQHKHAIVVDPSFSLAPSQNSIEEDEELSFIKFQDMNIKFLSCLEQRRRRRRKRETRTVSGEIEKAK